MNINTTAKSVCAALIGAAAVAGVTSCAGNRTESPMKQKVEEYAPFELTSPLAAQLSDNERQIVELFFQIGQIADDLFWQQTFGDKSLMDQIADPYARQFAYINYGPWDRLDDNKPFIDGYGAKPDVCTYYPADITLEEFNAYDDPNKSSWYTVLRRDENGALKTVWYHEEYAEQVNRMCELMQQAADLAEDPGLKNYLLKRIESFRTDDYLPSDLAWMDMKDSRIDFVIGPIESYDDKFQETKTSYEAFILLKDTERSKDLAKFVAMLPALQKELPCKPEYKTIAINLPNDERVHAMKGTRRLQLRNSMQAKFDKILLPIGELVLAPEDHEHLKFDAFFWNVTFHEVAHGLGIKETINGKGSVDAAMGTEKTSWEEAKADILGLFMVCNLIEKGEITGISIEDAVTTYIAGIFRSVRFGAASSHGKANMMCFNFMEQQGAFSRNADGLYVIDFEKSKAAINAWADLILTTQGNGDVTFATEFREKNGGITPALQADLDRINAAGIPKDIFFIQGPDVLFGTK